MRRFNVTPAKVNLIKDQLTELLTGYGEVDILITDGWDAPWSRLTYEEVPFHEIYQHVKNLQPNCLNLRSQCQPISCERTLLFRCEGV